MSPSDGGANRLRARIDAGETRDKVDFPDPAAAPLGTDDEAAGTAPAVAAGPGDRVAGDVPAAGRASDRAPAETGEAARSISGETRRPLRLGIAVAVAAAAVVLVAVVALLA